MLTGRLVSEGAQEHLGSDIGQLAMLGGGIAGGATGNMANYGTAYDSLVGGGQEGLTYGMDYGAPDLGGWAGGAGGYGMEAGGRDTSNWLFNSPLKSLQGWAQNTGVQPWGSSSNLMSMGSGIYGLMEADKLKKMAMLAQQQADPWGASGGRAMAGGQLQQLLQDPNMVTSMPGWKAGLQAVQRKMGTMPGSGNMMSALSEYGGNFYNNALSQLGGLAGANANPAAAQQLALSGMGMGTDVASRSLATLGYGVQRTQPNQVPSWLQ